MNKKVGRPAGTRSEKTYPRVKKLLEDHNKKHIDLARHLKMDPSILSNILHARKGLTDYNAEIISQFFDYEISAAYIQGKTDDPDPGIVHREYEYEPLLKEINSVIAASMDLFEAYGITFEYYCLVNEIDTIPDKYVLKYPMLSAPEPNTKALEYMYQTLTDPIQESIIYSVKRKGKIIAFITYSDLRHLQYMVYDFMNVQFMSMLEHLSITHTKTPKHKTSIEQLEKFIKSFTEERPDYQKTARKLLDITEKNFENIHVK